MSVNRDAILEIDAMGAADRFAISQGRPGSVLMEAAGQGIVTAITKRYALRPTAVLCGPGNNGGDGWEAATRLRALGWPVRLFSMVDRAQLKGDAALSAAKWDGPVEPLAACDPTGFGLIVDALFGAGLTRPLDGDAARLAEASAHGPIIVAADVPSGLHGDRARADGPVFRADLTVTFHQVKPAHVLEPGRSTCGEVVLIDIGIPDGWKTAAPPCGQVNHPALWRLPELTLPADAHKHSRGRLCVIAGPAGATGAARLAARAGLTGGAGFVTVLCEPPALPELAASEPFLVTRSYRPSETMGEVLAAHRASAAVLGPGGGVTESLKRAVVSALSLGTPLVLDADALTVFADDPDFLFDIAHAQPVLTPHAGEFARLFPALARDNSLNKIEKTRQAAARSGCIVLFKGPDTVIADPSGAVRVNIHASPRLATAGTGDVLAGLIGALMAQGVAPFDAASAGAWLHGEAGRRCGPGATVRDVLDKLPSALARLGDLQHRKAALQRIMRASR
jgi:NAD(P)H-hydrate epimerase